MSYFSPFRLSAVISLFAVLLLSGCCANKVCDCPNEQSDAIKMVFDRSKFSTADLDTIVIQRYPLVITRTTKPETVTLFRTTAQAYDTLYLKNSTPFAQVGANKLNHYQYYVRYFETPRHARPKTVLVIDNIALQGSLEADGCCTCYNNTQKTVTTRTDSLASPATAKSYDLKSKQFPALTISQ